MQFRNFGTLLLGTQRRFYGVTSVETVADFDALLKAKPKLVVDFYATYVPVRKAKANLSFICLVVGVVLVGCLRRFWRRFPRMTS